jgi:hypothetical protein
MGIFPLTLMVFFLSFFFVVGLGLEFRALGLQSRCSATSATPSVHFALIILEIGFCELFAWLASNVIQSQSLR